jgi:hypothetical protein
MWRAARAIALGLLLGLTGACGGDGGVSDQKAAAPPHREAPSADGQSASPRDPFRHCGALPPSDRIFPASSLRDARNYPASGDAALVPQHELVRPGTIFGVVPVNRTQRSILYGRAYRVSRKEAGLWRRAPPPRQRAFRGIGLSAEPGHAGSCVSVLVPTTYEPGRYRARLPDTSLIAEFRVAGAPLEKSSRERALDRHPGSP